MTKTQFLPIFLGIRYARSEYFWVQNFQGNHVFGFEFYPPCAHPRIQIYKVPLGSQECTTRLTMLTGGKNYSKIKIVETAQLALPRGLQIYLIFTISENVDHTDYLCTRM